MMGHEVPTLRSHQALEQGLDPTMALQPWPLQGEKEPGETTHNLFTEKIRFHDASERCNIKSCQHFEYKPNLPFFKL